MALYNLWFNPPMAQRKGLIIAIVQVNIIVQHWVPAKMPLKVQNFMKYELRIDYCGYGLIW